MKTQIILLFIFLISTCSCKAQKRSTIEGTWDLLSAKGYHHDGTKYFLKKDKSNHFIKMIYDNHVLFAGQFVSAGDTTISYGGGTYIFKNNIYTENTVYQAAKELIGDTLSFEVTLNKDTLIQKGPINKGIKWYLEETYIRLR